MVLFLLVPDFSMISFTACLEPLRVANRMAERPLYVWRTASIDGAPVRASNGVPVMPDIAIGDAGRTGMAVVCAGLNADRFSDGTVLAWLRQTARAGVTMGGICTGALILARAGLLTGRRCTIHWENMEGFAEEFPEQDITATMFEVDRDRFTCSGGTAPLDMMVHLIGRDHGEALAMQVAEQMLHTPVRHAGDPQRSGLQYRTGISHPKLLAAIAAMEAHLEAPLGMDDLAAQVGLSPRQLERLFRQHLDRPPRRYYLELRLKRARHLLLQTPMPVIQVAVACGFTSASHFADAYHACFGHAPRAERQRGNGGPAAAGDPRRPRD
ncbi:GlxA family transcriptional regulator [Marinibaculum pumilum]|uniref:GlxA family transcriptional regulator n=1 Tax=Marinibaculum pumilum TaxID=1766165 RepID=A0ABV7L007_9PROT